MRSEGWLNPRQNYNKLNTDAPSELDSLKGARGAVLRDGKGNFIVVANKKLDSCVDAFTTEAVSLAFGLNLA